MQLLSGLIGVLVGGLITAGAQWFLDPRVQRRIRREERVEGEVLELAKLVREDIPDAARDLKSAGWTLAHIEQRIAAGEWDGANPAVRELRDRLFADFEQAGRRWSGVTGWRLKWLVERTGKGYSTTHLRFWLEATRVASASWQLAGKSDDELDEEWEAERQAHQALVKLVDEVVEAHAPGQPGQPYRQPRRLGFGPRRKVKPVDRAHDEPTSTSSATPQRQSDASAADREG